MFSKKFVRFTWITLIFIFLVVIAGSVVRSAGAGMGCPDWPKCFDQIVPPTSIDELPENYKDIYLEKRTKKVNKFIRLMAFIGFTETAMALSNDESLYEEQDFNALKTWIEYGNRLVGFVAGNLVLIGLIWALLQYRQHKKLVFLSALNLVLMLFEGWLGSIVVATNLVPWVLTLHMLFALIIIWIQIKIIQIVSAKSTNTSVSKTFKILFYFSIFLTIFQILLGSQVRQEIDFMVAENMDRGEWIANMGGDFYFHRSFSWLVLLVNLILYGLNYRFKYKIKTLNWSIGLIIVEFITGILFSYAGMPAIIQPIHLIAATLLLTIQIYSLKYFNKKDK